MKITKLKWRYVLFIVMGLLVVYFVVPFPFLGARGRDDVRESAIRWLLRHNDSGTQGKLQVCFVGIGTTFDPGDRDFAPQDPPKPFVDRFADFPVPVLPVSAITNATRRIGGGVADATGKSGLIFGAGNVKRRSMGLVLCRGFYYEGGLSSAGYDIVILRVPFAWIPVWARMLWIS
jgi:hypothetical protein